MLAATREEMGMPWPPAPAGQLGMGSASSGEGLPHPCLTVWFSSHLLDVGEAVVPLQSGGDADGSVHAQGVLLQAAGGGRVRAPTSSKVWGRSSWGAGYSLEPAEAPVHLQRVGHRFGSCHADGVSSQAAKEGRPWGRTARGDPWAPCSPWARGGGGRGSPTSASQGTGKSARA